MKPAHGPVQATKMNIKKKKGKKMKETKDQKEETSFVLSADERTNERTDKMTKTREEQKSRANTLVKVLLIISHCCCWRRIITPLINFQVLF